MNIKQLLLVKLMEECAEVQQICSKTVRFGTKESYNCESGTNIERLESELLDILAVLMCLKLEGVITLPSFNDPKMDERIARIDKYMEYSRELGILK